MAALPPWLTKLTAAIGADRQPRAEAERRIADAAPPTGVLRPKSPPRADSRAVALKPSGQVAYPAARRPALPPHVKQLTPAAMIYALAAGVLATLAIYNLFHGSYFNGIVTLLPAGGLAVLAYKYIQ